MSEHWKESLCHSSLWLAIEGSAVMWASACRARVRGCHLHACVAVTVRLRAPARSSESAPTRMAQPARQSRLGLSGHESRGQWFPIRRTVDLATTSSHISWSYLQRPEASRLCFLALPSLPPSATGTIRTLNTHTPITAAAAVAGGDGVTSLGHGGLGS